MSRTLSAGWGWGPVADVPRPTSTAARSSLMAESGRRAGSPSAHEGRDKHREVRRGVFTACAVSLLAVAHDTQPAAKCTRAACKGTSMIAAHRAGTPPGAACGPGCLDVAASQAAHQQTDGPICGCSKVHGAGSCARCNASGWPCTNPCILSPVQPTPARLQHAVL